MAESWELVIFLDIVVLTRYNSNWDKILIRRADGEKKYDTKRAGITGCE